MSLAGGAAVTLCEAANPRGGSWSTDGTIVFAPSTTSGLSRVRDSEKAPRAVTNPEAKGQRTHRWPQFLPDGRHVIFTAHTVSTGFDEAEIEVVDLANRRVENKSCAAASTRAT